MSVIAQMKRLSIVCMKEDRERLLESLQKCGEIMLCDREEGRSDQSAAQKAREMEQLIKELKPYRPPKNLFETAPPVGMDVFEKDSGEEQQLASQMEALLSDVEALQKKLEGNKALYRQLLPWKELTVPVEQLGESAYTRSVVGTLPTRAYPQAVQTAAQQGAGLDMVSQTPAQTCLALTSLKGEDSAWIKDLGFETVSLPLSQGKVSENLDRLSGQIQEEQQLLHQKQEELKKLASGSDAPDLLYEQYHAQSQREQAPVTETIETVCLEAWAPADRLDRVKKAVERVTEVYLLDSRDPLPEETAPTVLRNNWFVRQFEGITNMFNAPRYGGVDPNPVMAPWYWLIFGLMMGDAGYGLMMAVLIVAGKKLIKPKGNTLKLMNVMLYSSLTTMVCGVLFGSYFGETWHPILFSPLDNPVAMLILTLVIGVAHIFTGMIVNMVMKIKAGRLWDAVFDDLSWMLVIGGIGMFFLPAVKTVGIVLAAVGAVVILLTAGRSKKGFFGKVAGGLGGLYGITNYLSDILSYSRILALSLATGVVGMVMNMLAGMLQGSALGFVLSLAIYVVGHVFNLALGLLSAYVHDCRLQYIEFYGKFYEGGGELFEPFAIRTQYITLEEQQQE